MIQDTPEQGTEPSTVIPNLPIVHDLPIALRKPVRRPVTPPHLKDYVGHKHDIAKFISYDNCNPLFKSFIASLDSISIPKDWREAMQDTKWKAAMIEEMKALEKNRT